MRNAGPPHPALAPSSAASGRRRPTELTGALLHGPCSPICKMEMASLMVPEPLSLSYENQILEETNSHATAACDLWTKD